MEAAIILAIESMTAGNPHLAKRAKELGYQLRMVTEDASIYNDLENLEVVELPTRSYAALQDYVAQHRQEIAAIFSPTDTWGVDAAKLRDEFGFESRYTAQELAQFRDKSWVRETLTAGKDQASTYPRILKPRNGTGSMGIRVVNTPGELEAAAAEMKDTEFVDEPYYQGPLYSAEMYSDGARVEFFGVTNRILTSPPVFLERVKTFPHEYGSKWEKRVCEWATETLGILGYNAGFAHLEFIETADGFELVELNARMAGSLITPAVEACTNYNPYAMVIDDALGRDIEVPAQREVYGGHSHVSIYADHVGTLREVTGTSALPAFPGSPKWVPAKEAGAEITELGTYRCRIGNVFATADSPGLAQDRAIAAAQAIGVLIE